MYWPLLQDIYIVLLRGFMLYALCIICMSCMCVKIIRSAAPAHARTRAHRPAARGSRLYCTMIYLANTPFILFCAVYIIARYWYYHLLHPPARSFEVFLRWVWILFLFSGLVRCRISDESRCQNRNPFSTHEKGAFLHMIVQCPPPRPALVYCLQQYISQYIFPTTL